MASPKTFRCRDLFIESYFLFPIPILYFLFLACPPFEQSDTPDFSTHPASPIPPSHPSRSSRAREAIALRPATRARPPPPVARRRSGSRPRHGELYHCNTRTATRPFPFGPL